MPSIADFLVKGNYSTQQIIEAGMGFYRDNDYTSARLLFAEGYKISQEDERNLFSLYYQIVMLREGIEGYLQEDLDWASRSQLRTEISKFIIRKDFFVRKEKIINEEDSKRMDDLVIEMHYLVDPDIILN